MNEPINTSHAKKLRYLRKVLDKKQTEIASHLNISQQAYSDLENGKTFFTDETIEKIASYFKITSADFEKPIDTINIGNNNSNTGSNINTVDLKLLTALEKTYSQNIELLNILLNEKDTRIKMLEKILFEKNS
jgi:transcriptional regulator with XRE-family HTH domain